MASCDLALESGSYFCHTFSIKVLPRLNKGRNRPHLLMKECRVLKDHVVWEILVQPSLETIACHRCWSSSYHWGLAICSSGQTCAFEYGVTTVCSSGQTYAFEYEVTTVCSLGQMCTYEVMWDAQAGGEPLLPWPHIFTKTFSGWPSIDKNIKGPLWPLTLTPSSFPPQE